MPLDGALIRPSSVTLVIGRSRQRREADPQYFEKRKPLVEEASTTAAPGSITEVPSEAADDEEEQQEEKVLDPFRSYQPKTRNKVFVK